VASLGISLANAPSLVAAEAAAEATAVVNADPWSVTIATRRAICLESVLRVKEVAAAAVAAVAIVTIAANPGICLAIAPSRDKEAAAAAVETAITAASRVISPGIARSRDKAAAAAETAIAFSATGARDMATCRVNAPSSEFPLGKIHQAAIFCDIKGSNLYLNF